jgi:hypothetical protein
MQRSIRHVPRRFDLVGAVLLAVALVAAWRSYDQRDRAAQWYERAADYNRAITAFLVDHRDRLAGGRVAVYGVSAHSPWSLSAGGYLARLLGRDHRWDVFVAQPDPFYPVGAFRNGSVVVHGVEQACTVAAGTEAVHVVIAPDGRPQFAATCAEALALATPHPVVTSWGPQAVTPAQRDAGFNMFFTGQDLVRGVRVRIGGQSTPMTYAQRGALMTTSVPPQPSAPAIPFTVVRGDDVVLSGTVSVR